MISNHKGGRLIDLFNNARNFIYRNARPIEFALWKYHFENGSKESVLEALKAYQNDDGGFGHALEPDSFNPGSSPITTNHAVKILDEINFLDSKHEIIRGILKYLESEKGFFDGKWCFTIPSNNDFPHAVWWDCENDVGEPSDNPTVSLAGFVLKVGNRDSELYGKCRNIINRCVEEYLKNDEEEIHTLLCYINLLSYVVDSDAEVSFDTEALRDRLITAADKLLCKEPERWESEYVCKPSNFFHRSMFIFDSISDDLKQAECRMIEKTQLPDGSFDITWQWHNDYKEFEISKNFWKSVIAIKNIRYYLEVGK